MARFTTRGLTWARRGGRGLARTAQPILPMRLMLVPAMTPAAWMIWSRAVFRATVKLARSGLAAAGSQQTLDKKLLV